MKANLEKLDIKWECSKLGTPKKLTSWDELHRMTEMASEDLSKDMNPRLLNAKKCEDWTHHTFSCIDIDRPDDGYVEKIMQSNVMGRFSNIIFVQKSYHGKLHIVYQLPDTDDFEIAKLYICAYIQEFMDWCEGKIGVKFTAADKRKIRNSYRIATDSPELIYDEGDIDLKFASNKVQPVYINSNEIIANENYREWHEEEFFGIDRWMVFASELYFKYMVTNVGIQLCDEGKVEHPLYSRDADEVFDKSKEKLSELFTNILNDSELDSKKCLSLYKIIEEVRNVIQDYYVNLFSNIELDGKKGLSLYKAEPEGRKYRCKALFDRYSNDFQEVSKRIPYCCDTLTLDFQYDGYETMLDNCISVIRNTNISYQAKKDEKKLFKPDYDISSGQRFNALPEFYFTDGEKITGKDVKKYLKQAIKSACLNAAASINLKRGEISDEVLSNYEECCCPGMVVATVLYWIDNTCDESIDYKTLIEYFSTVKKDFDEINVGVLANKYKSKHGRLETKEDKLRYGREVVLPKKYAAVEKTVIEVIDEAYPNTNDFEVKDIVELLNNYNGVGVQKKRDGKWTEESVKRIFNKKFGGLKAFKKSRITKIK